MIETIFLTLIISKIRGYKLKLILKEWTFYPVIILTLVYIVINVTMFYGYYGFVKYSKILEMIYLSTFLFLIFKYELYNSAIIGSVFVFMGTALNKIAININGGHMPVFPSISYYIRNDNIDLFAKASELHVLGNRLTKVKILTDYIDLGYSILSIGDIFIRYFTFIIILNAIKYINKENSLSVDS